MYLIIGGSGFLGRYVIKNVLELTGEEIIATYNASQVPADAPSRLTWHSLDICDTMALQDLRAKLPETVKVIYLAAYHQPDKVEEHPQLAWQINIVALANAINIFDQASCFYYSSTDTVYGEGSKTLLFTEDSPLQPVNLYGRHKVLAEQITIAHGGNVVRFPFIIGPSLVEGRKHFFDIIREELSQGRTMEMFMDSYRSTLDFNQCAKLLVQLVEQYGSKAPKVVNISGDDVLSKYEVACLMADKYQLNRGLIRPVSLGDNQTIFRAKRAKSAILDNSLLKRLLRLSTIKLEV